MSLATALPVIRSLSCGQAGLCGRMVYRIGIMHKLVMPGVIQHSNIGINCPGRLGIYTTRFDLGWLPHTCRGLLLQRYRSRLRLAR